MPAPPPPRAHARGRARTPGRWLLLCLVAVTSSGVNVLGFIKCKKDARSKLTALGSSVLNRGLEMYARNKGSFAIGGAGGGGS